jgi:RNA recognition motif-containing protein
MIAHVLFIEQIHKECSMNIYVGNLSHEATEDDVQEAFTSFGRVSSVTIIKDKFSGEPRGFGFVEMPVQSEALAAIAGLAGKELRGRQLNVNEARPRSDDRRGGNRGGGRRSW